MTDLFPAGEREYTLLEMRDCIKREVGFREHVYPRRVAEGKMKQAKADWELACMRAVLKTIEAQLPKGK